MDIVIQSAGPAVIAAVLMLLLGRMWKAGERDVGWAAALALGVGTGASYVLIKGWPEVPPLGSTQVVPYVAVAAGLVGAVSARWLRAWWMQWLGAIGVGFAAIWMMTRSFREHTWESTEATYWLTGLTAVIAGLWLCLRGQAMRWPGRSFVVTYGMFVAVMSGVLVLSGTASYGQLAGGLAAALGGVFLVTLWRKEARWFDGAVTVLAVMIGHLLASGYLTALDFKWYVAMMVLAGPVLGFASELTFLRRRTGWLGFAIRMGLVVVPVAAAAVVAKLTEAADTYGYGGY